MYAMQAWPGSAANAGTPLEREYEPNLLTLLLITYLPYPGKKLIFWGTQNLRLCR